MSKLDYFKKMDRNTVLVGIAVIGIVVCAGLIYANSNHGFGLPTIFGASDSKIGQAAVSYINNNGLSSTPATLVSVSETSGLIKVKIKIGTQSFDSYATKDGKLLFPQAFDMSVTKTAATPANKNTAATPSQTPAQAAAAIKKTSSPMLEAFVVSSCPFGLQMQRAMADAVKNIPQLAQYVKVRYIGDVNGKTIDSMHGPEEGAENLRQICIREEQPSVFWNYLSCYMQKTTATAASGMPLGDSTGCQASTGVDTAKLNACVSDPSRGIAYAQKDFAEDTKYSVQGSPTLILNGAAVSENSFGGRSSDGVKSMVCAAFNSQPSFCSTKLNTTEAATSFSVSYASGSGSGTASAACGS
ncbi:MAG: hypothetical protein ABSA74_02275 [Candidatus Staskawiczbacteria bacterium]|jgi:hypothetical protein